MKVKEKKGYTPKEYREERKRNDFIELVFLVLWIGFILFATFYAGVMFERTNLI